jgi:hypothetical protein
MKHRSLKVCSALEKVLHDKIEQKTTSKPFPELLSLFQG